MASLDDDTVVLFGGCNRVNCSSATPSAFLGENAQASEAVDVGLIDRVVGPPVGTRLARDRVGS